MLYGLFSALRLKAGCYRDGIALRDLPIIQSGE
jgi:hypothetical protein